MSLLSIHNLSVSIFNRRQETPLLKDVSLSVPSKTIVALVGGSGSGKTTTGLAILKLLPLALRQTGGEVVFDGQTFAGLSRRKMRHVRGRNIGMIFQEPLYAFNPVFSIGYQIEEVLRTHTKLNRRQRRERILELLDLVGLPEPKRVKGKFPHQLSGGMRQRAMIAQAVAANPKLIIADEPTSNLDVTLQAKILELFRHLRQQLDLSLLLITHDLGVVAHLADEVAVMSEGQIVETGETQAVLTRPRAAYTQELIEGMI